MCVLAVTAREEGVGAGELGCLPQPSGKEKWLLTLKDPCGKEQKALRSLGHLRGPGKPELKAEEVLKGNSVPHRGKKGRPAPLSFSYVLILTFLP